MTKGLWTITEVIEKFQIKKAFIYELEREEIICPTCRDNSQEKLLSSTDLEKLQFARILFDDMDVNLPGIEVILQMRQNILDMRKQFDAILEDLGRRLQDKFGGSL